MAFLFITLFCSIFFASHILSPLYNAQEIIIDFGLKPFDICKENLELWNLIKKIYIFTFVFSNLIINNYLYNFLINFIKKSIKKNNKKNIKKLNKNEINLIIGYNEKLNQNIIISEKGLYQNILITGTIGTGKTSSAMYPFTRQLMEYNFKNNKNKIGMLILDVKGNYYKQVKKYAKKYYLEKDLIVLELNSKIKYNPLHKPRIKTSNLSK